MREETTLVKQTKFEVSMCQNDGFCVSCACFKIRGNEFFLNEFLLLQTRIPVTQPEEFRV